MRKGYQVYHHPGCSPAGEHHQLRRSPVTLTWTTGVRAYLPPGAALDPTHPSLPLSRLLTSTASIPDTCTNGQFQRATVCCTSNEQRSSRRTVSHSFSLLSMTLAAPRGQRPLLQTRFDCRSRAGVLALNVSKYLCFCCVGARTGGTVCEGWLACGRWYLQVPAVKASHLIHSRGGHKRAAVRYQSQPVNAGEKRHT